LTPEGWMGFGPLRLKEHRILRYSHIFWLNRIKLDFRKFLTFYPRTNFFLNISRIFFTDSISITLAF
jgi:hypothetical protein